MLKSDQDRYEVFARRDKRYDGTLFVGVLTTGIFCRPGCPARLPNFENCRFFPKAEQALKSGFRACKRCHPAAKLGEGSALTRKLIAMIEDDPERRWGEADLTARGIDPSTARRHFKSRFGMSFSAYARQRRLALAAQHIAKGGKKVEAQIMAGYDSASGFQTAFGQALGQCKPGQMPMLADWIDTPMGPMIAIADSQRLYLLEFTDRKAIDKQVEKLSRRRGCAVLVGQTDIHKHIRSELDQYFAGDLQQFQTPFEPTGTEFQRRVWEQLCAIPYGQTRSYAQLATAAGNEKAVRAAASSNARNGLAIIIPCHRVIGSDGGLGGYAGGIDRKARLLALEKNNAAKT